MSNAPHTRHDSMDAAVSHNAQAMAVLRDEAKQLRVAVTEELCSLRHDIDLLRCGGWELKIGAFQTILAPDSVGVDRIRERLLVNGMNGLDVSDDKIAHSGNKLPGDSSTKQHAEAKKIEGSEANMVQVKNGVPTPIEERPKATPRRKSPLSKKFPSPDDAIPSIEDPAASARSNYMPLVIRQLSPLMPEIASGIPNPAATRTFSVEFIHDFFGGSQWSPGYFFIPRGTCVLSSRSYYGLDASTDPFLPPAPGTHGAKLVPFIRCSTVDNDPDEEHILDVPMFVRASKFATLTGKPSNEYIYFGNYSQLRFSDRVDYERSVEVVSNDVKMHWADQLADLGRPQWVSEALKAHFFDHKKPELSTSGQLTTAAVQRYLDEVDEWHKEASIGVQQLTTEAILKSFENADCAQPAGMRLWWEYLQCVGYDDSFYKALLKRHDIWKKG